MDIDYKSMSRKQLEKHLEEVKKALKTVTERERREALKAAEKAAADFGFSLADLTSEAEAPAKARKTRGKKSPAVSKPKYANPENPSDTWTGKGRQPNWYRAAIANGISPDRMMI